MSELDDAADRLAARVREQRRAEGLPENVDSERAGKLIGAVMASAARRRATSQQDTDPQK